MEIVVLFGSMTILLALSLPICISLGMATAITLVYTKSVPLIMIAQNAFAALDSFPLLAIPFFMLAGALMSYGGISKRLVSLAEAMVGAVIGGLAMVTVTACMFFAAISGSGPATVSAIGSFMIPAMKAKMYDDDFAAALTAAAGSIGVIIPPSIPFVIYGVVSGASVGELFMAGILPGIIIGFSLMAVSYRTAKKRNYPVSQNRVPIGKAFREAVWALLVPLINLGGIYGGIGKFIYKELDYRTTYDAFKAAVLVNEATTFMIGLSMSFAAFLAMEQVPAKIGAWMLSLSSSPAMILLIINILLLIVGCFVDNISSMIILTPILLPIVTKIGVDPVHFGLVMTVALATGFVTPPYGANLFVASAVSGVSMVRLSKAIIPMIAVMVLCLLLFTYFPSISMCLVRALR